MSVITADRAKRILHSSSDPTQVHGIPPEYQSSRHWLMDTRRYGREWAYVVTPAIGVDDSAIPTLIGTKSHRTQRAAILAGIEVMRDVIPDVIIEGPADVRHAVADITRLLAGGLSPSDPPGWRADARLIRYLAHTFSPGVAADWQSKPVVSLASRMADIRSTIVEVYRNVPSLVNRPWDDVCLDLGRNAHAGRSMLYLGGSPIAIDEAFIHVWARVTPTTVVRRHPHWFPWVPPFEGEGLLVSIFPWFVRSDCWSDPFVVLHDTNDWASGRAIVDSQIHLDESDRSQFAESVVRITVVAAAALAYLAQTPSWLVEERSPVHSAKRLECAKPWTREGLPRIILLDPDHATSHTSSQTGQGASKRPHQRRGHWRTLRAPIYYQYPWSENFDPTNNPRRMFVKPAWIGPTDWQADGAMYRVLKSENSV